MCNHDLGSGMSTYDHASKTLRGIIVCDHCQNTLAQAYQMDYEPRPAGRSLDELKNLFTNQT